MAYLSRGDLVITPEGYYGIVLGSEKGFTTIHQGNEVNTRHREKHLVSCKFPDQTSVCNFGGILDDNIETVFKHYPGSFIVKEEDKD